MVLHDIIKADHDQPGKRWVNVATTTVIVRLVLIEEYTIICPYGEEIRLEAELLLLEAELPLLEVEMLLLDAGLLLCELLSRILTPRLLDLANHKHNMHRGYSLCHLQSQIHPPLS